MRENTGLGRTVNKHLTGTSIATTIAIIVNIYAKENSYQEKLF